MCHAGFNRNYKFSHKKPKDRLDGILGRVLFVAQPELPKILVPRMPQNITYKNTECGGKSKLQYSLCDQALGALIYLYFIVMVLICF